MRGFYVFNVVIGVILDDYSCLDTICSPRAGDLLIGRDNALAASSTCGLEKVDTYCVVTAGGKSHCSECYSKLPFNEITNPNSHRIENVISRVPSLPGRWWQSESAVHNVTLTLNLETQFQFISTILRFKTFRPAAMYLERSVDFAQTWQPYAYFSNNCPRDYPLIPERPRKTLDDVTCTSIYSQLTPSEGGVVAFMAAPSEMHANLAPYSEERQNLTAVTNLRVTFSRLNTLGDMQLDNSSAIRRKYYYAMYEWNVWGRCSCFGHATRCKPKSPHEVPNMEKVYGVCECTHNTAGDNCERCAGFYQNKPWRPASRHSANACEKCKCNDHTDQCYFDPILYVQSGNVSGGHCYECGHHTEGAQCEFCTSGYYRHPEFPVSHPHTCQPCNCHAGGSEAHENCDQYTVPSEGKVAGRCVCKLNVGGDKCDRCRVGFWNFRGENPNGCEECKCHMLGTQDNSGCDQFTGACTCKRFVGGELCDRCLPGFFNLTTSSTGCQPCSCSAIGSLGGECDADRGLCNCKPHFGGRDCSVVDDGYYVRPPQVVIDRPGQPIEIAVEKPTKDGDHVVIIETNPRNFGYGDRWFITVDVRQDDSSCRNQQFRAELTGDKRKVVLPRVCLTGDRKTIIAIMPERRDGSTQTEILIGNIIVKADDGDASYISEYCENFREIAEEVAMGQADPSKVPERCQTYFNIHETQWRDTGAEAFLCGCNVTGSIIPVCDKLTGQCPCRPGVVGKTCNRCEAYHYHFSASGCTACNCSRHGSLDLQCDVISSQCPCRPGIEGRKCDRCGHGYWNFPYCQRCECNGLANECDQLTGACIGCRNNTGGPMCESCAPGFYGDPLRGVPCKPCECPGGGVDNSEGCSMHPVVGMQCHCKRGYTGPRCSECAPNFFGNPTEPGGECKPCDCSGNLPTEGGCDQVTGNCLVCLYNTEGDRCDRCIDGFWGNASLQACQKCSCYHQGAVGGVETTCDRQTGACNCLPNVLGPRCFECAPQHFNLSSGFGCERCNCDPSGSLSLDCHPQTGQCTCRPDRSGRKCDQCQRTFYGDPRSPHGCQRCDCDRTGSLGDVCDTATGQCVCREGIAGRRCDRCDRGTTGNLPHCIPCGECWTNWDNAITDLINEMERLQNQTSSQLPPDLKPVYNILKGLVEQLELIPGSSLTDEQLGKLSEVANLLEKEINLLDSPDGALGKFPKALDALKRLQDEQNGLEKSLTDHQAFLEKLNTDLDDMVERSHGYSILDPYGAHTALRKAEEDGQKIAALQRSLESRQSSLESLLNSATTAINSRSQDDEEFKRLKKLIGERMKDLQGDIKQINRLMCGDNGRSIGTRADINTCPSACGGASCDSVTPEVLDVKDFGSKSPAPPRPYGVIAECAGTTGCDKSLEGRLKQLMTDHLIAQNHLSEVLQRSMRVNNLISGIDASRDEAESIVKEINEQLQFPASRIEHVHNLTNAIIEEGKHALENFKNLTRQRFDDLVRQIMGLHHTTDLREAMDLGNQLQRFSDQLRDKAERILRETGPENRAAQDLLHRAERIRERAQSFLDQLKMLSDAIKIYDTIDVNPVFGSFDDQQHIAAITDIEQNLDGLEEERQLLSQETSENSDQANQNAATAQRLYRETEAAKRLGLSSLQDLQTLNSSFTQMDEKLNILSETMDRIFGKNGKKEPDATIEDPSELAKQVNTYIEKLESDLAEVTSLIIPLDSIEKEIADITGQLEKTVNQFKALGSQISPNTKHQRFCS